MYSELPPPNSQLILTDLWEDHELGPVLSAPHESDISHASLLADVHGRSPALEFDLVLMYVVIHRCCGVYGGQPMTDTVCLACLD